MRILPLPILAPLSAMLLGACASTGGVFSSAEVAQCEKALAVLVRTGPNTAKYSVDDSAEAARTVDGQKVTDVTLTYIQNNTRKLASCFYPRGRKVAVGYVFEGQRLSDAATAAVNRQL
ncbi:MAG: hypothetical protein OYG32_07965 [Rhodospirillaceae bacterium]|nr:hypothetical protein [Rhodospirillaceae bacterium]MDE0254717.1 hypothetical protein [Rhodospirillaceae bacterium]MDE0616356.1 hypothetical protein [Rhodospirillaceae bacterium]